MSTQNPSPRGPKRCDPWIPAGHPQFVWTSGADVQSTWRRYGWRPPSEGRELAYVEVRREPEWVRQSRRTAAPGDTATWRGGRAEAPQLVVGEAAE